MQTPKIAYRKGFYHEVKAGQRYLWCSCGLSANQPFCDGSHAGTEFLPVLVKPKADEDVIFCGCKHTGTAPFCDGAHNNLPGYNPDDDPDSPANQAIPMVAHGEDARVSLDNQCYVFSTRRAKLTPRGSMGYCPVISPAQGALFQSQFYAEVGQGASPILSADDRHTVLFITEGWGELEISGRRFTFEPRTGFYVRPSEAYRVHNPGPGPIKLYISNGPGAEDLVWLEAMPDNFEAEHPNRRAEIDPDQRHAMAERHFQMLVNREHGSTVVTQFIGNIPRSKAEPHQHLYEEALIFLNGAGVVWTERTRTEVGPGDILFLPSKQVHSVQCTVDGGFDVVGVIYPGDNPSINY
ncbi:MAG TPA: CDGSH iron-sulfur domain-containing protein [Caulobacteraceae bacterium]|jgi:CDGSH-type Zn-finger protein/mannose-6-phosphate isomerase-like protein (cupin superfamily)